MAIKTKQGVVYDHTKLAHRKALAKLLLDVLHTAGFEEEPSRGRRVERMFVRKIPHIQAFVRVYTSIEGEAVRAVGDDAVRIVGFAIKGKRELPIAKATRVHRTGTIGAIGERMLTRTREVWKAAEVNAKKRCEDCGAALFLSKRGNEVCSDLCWKKG